MCSRSRSLSQGLHVCGLVEEGVAVPEAALALDQALDLLPRDVGGAFEVHVFDPVAGAGGTRSLVLAADVVPSPDRDQRGEMRRRPQQDAQAVVQPIINQSVAEGHTPSVRLKWAI